MRSHAKQDLMLRHLQRTSYETSDVILFKVIRF